MILRVLVAIQMVFKLTFKKLSDNYSVVNRDVLEMVSNMLELDEEFLGKTSIKSYYPSPEKV